MPTLNFKGKASVQNHHLAVKYHQLLPQPEQCLTENVSLHDNLIIQGDNLKALKALLPLYSGKIDCIYIDPPYNTGEENWKYNDNVNSPMLKEWLGKVVDKEDLTRHDKWLCMMMPRLRLLRELLSQNGVIFVSIDDNEASHLKMLIDEVFGQNKFIGQLIWKSRQNKDNRTVTGASIDHEYVFAYGSKLRGSQRNLEQFSNPDNDPRGAWASGNMVGLADEEQRPNLHYDLINPVSGINYGKPKRGWRYEAKRMADFIEENRIIWPKSPTGRPRIKSFLSEFSQVYTGFSSIIGEQIFTRNGTHTIEEIFKERVMDFPKPVDLIKSLIIQATTSGSIILDSFAGSGTTAQAVLSLNNEDGGKRKFILVECEDYADSITAERVRRVIHGVPEAKDEALRKGLGGSFSYFVLGPPIEMEQILTGESLPEYDELARYVFYTATGEEFHPEQMERERFYIGENQDYEVFLFYEPNLEYLHGTALTMEMAKNLGPYQEKKRLVFAPSKFLDADRLLEYRIEFCQLPFEIYRLKG